MRLTNALLIVGAVLLAFGLFSLVYSTIDPDGGDSVRGVFAFGTPFFPAMMGLLLIVAGYTVSLLGRLSWDMPQMA